MALNNTMGTGRQPAAYRVQREIQTEEHLQAYYEREVPSALGRDLQISGKNRRLYCRFSWRRFRKMILMMFPILNWLFSYRFREWIMRDLHAGLSVGMFQIPQGLLGIWLTRLPLPNTNGFLSAFCCSITYVIFGTSHHISIGSFSILNMAATNILKTLNFNQTLSSNSSPDNYSDPSQALTLSASVTFLTGIIQLLLGCCCLGLVKTYMPKTLINACLTAAAVHVIVAQLTFIFDIVLDIPARPLDIFCNLYHFFLAIPKANATSILLFLLSMAVLQVTASLRIVYKRSLMAFPMELLLIITVTIISNCIRLHAESNNAVISMIPQRFLPPAVPDVSNLNKVILHAFSIAIVSYFLLVFVGEKYASLHSYHIASNQELIAVGLCNICSSFFKSFVVSCTISGTVIQERTGGRTQLAAAIGACVMLVIALKLGHFFQMIPNVIWLVAFAAVLCFGLDMGLVIATGFAFLLITIRLHRMKTVMLGQIPNTNIYRSLSDYKAAKEIEGIKIFQCCSSISFANMNCFKTYLLNKMDVKTVPLDVSEMRAFSSHRLAATTGGREDRTCFCVYDPPLPPTTILYREKLVKRHSTDSQSSSSSVNLVRWSKYGDKLSSRTLLVGAADASPDFHRGVRTGRNEQDRRACQAPGSAIDNSSVHFDQEQQPLPCPVHTIIFDFSMVQFVDLTGSDLLQQIIHMFHNIGITVLIAGCHSSMVADFEKNDFFDSCITKERFFLTLHDAVLAALNKHQKPDELDQAVREFAEGPPPEQKEVEYLA
ncbi:testis anion transporter 1 isoform X1 [Pezoporus wallicus]|uniref:testis anion transporter 1 isoform X1 n=1 Tax=Pezoporus wallicus TaxID=35540 RepID=UPI00254C48D1|nr:testis anion transporter 1 isoform X1 [Pezoporus wallicus]